MRKGILHILAGREKQISADEVVLQPLPHKEFRFANPLIVVHHLRPHQILAGSEERLDPHPHRGFAPVTYMLQGEGYHMDSAGHEGLVGAGDVQWMFAGSGLLHSEGPSETMLSHGGNYEFLQLWVNVPADKKMGAPHYQTARRQDQPLVHQQQGVELRLVTGEYEDKTGPIRTETPIVSMFGQIENGVRLQLEAQPGYWTVLYVASGKLTIDQEEVPQHHLVVFEKDNSEILLHAEANSTILYFSAEPIEEPVAARGNFVMNSVEELEQAEVDYKAGLFGQLAR